MGPDEYGRLISRIRLDLLELFGKEYIAQHVGEAYRAQQLKQTYQIYLAESLRLIGENTAKISGGRYLQVRWEDILHPKPEETRTPKEIIEKMKDTLSRL